MTDLSRIGPQKRSGLSQRWDWWRGAVIYQIYPRSFRDSNGDGIGDLPGITAGLDHVAALGVDAIWLCPFYASPQRDFGYDVSDHNAVDPLFGTLADFDQLVARAHALGLRVLVDQVWSHSSNEHAWFTRSRACRANPYADWYVWADPSADGTPPNNWLSVFGGPAWTWEPRRRQYYLHHFLSHQPQLNLHNPAVVDAILDSGRFWLDRGVDGFRLDAIDFMAHDPALRPNPPGQAGGPLPAKLFGMQRHDNDMLHPQGHAVLRRIRALLDDYPGTAALGEVSSQPGAYERVARYTASDDALHMAYTLRPLRGGFDWPTVRALLADMHAAGEHGWTCWSFSNHDVERAISRWNPCRDTHPDAPPDPCFARLLMSLLLSLRGSICLYQGEELGLTEASIPFEQMRDPFGIAYWPEFRGRDGSRTPMPWRAAHPRGGFTEGEPWLPMPDDHRALAADAQDADPDSLLNATREMIAFRATHPALVHGTIRPLDLPEPCIGFLREHAGEAAGSGRAERLLCLFNLSDRSVRIAASPVLDGLGLPTGRTRDGIVLAPYGACYVTLAATAAPAGIPAE